jgi:hypothetical protein
MLQDLCHAILKVCQRINKNFRGEFHSTGNSEEPAGQIDSDIRVVKFKHGKHSG